MNLINIAFQDIDRAVFLPDEAKAYANYDMPLQIGYGQTNSQPTTVRMMLEWLDPQLGEKILDVGSGSGWTTALLANLVGKSGFITATELVPELVKFGSENCKKVGVKNADFHQAKRNVFGWPKDAPYDRILVSASADKLPEELIDQLKIGGRLVVPVKNSIFVIDKISKANTEKTEHPGFAFVPLI